MATLIEFQMINVCISVMCIANENSNNVIKKLQNIRFLPFFFCFSTQSGILWKPVFTGFTTVINTRRTQNENKNKIIN